MSSPTKQARRSTRRGDRPDYCDAHFLKKIDGSVVNSKSSNSLEETPSKVLGRSLGRINLDSATKSTSNGEVSSSRHTRARRLLLTVNEEEEVTREKSPRRTKREKSTARNEAKKSSVETLKLTKNIKVSSLPMETSPIRAKSTRRKVIDSEDETSDGDHVEISENGGTTRQLAKSITKTRKAIESSENDETSDAETVEIAQTSKKVSSASGQLQERRPNPSDDDETSDTKKKQNADAMIAAFEDITAAFFTNGKSAQPPKPRRRRKRAQGNADPMRLDTSVAEGGEGESSDDDEPMKPVVATHADLADVKKYLADCDKTLKKPYSTLNDNFMTTQLPILMTSLRTGFNCILFGVGCKYHIVNGICDELKSNNLAHLRVDCHLRSTNMKHVLVSLVKLHNLDISTTSTTIIPLTQTIVKYAKEHKKFPNFALVLDGLDALFLRDRKTQECISLLCTIKQVRLIATIDHCNATVMWSQSNLARMNIRWFDATNYKTYGRELMAGESKLLGLSSSSRGSQHSLSSLDSLWASLTKNARRTLVIMAENAVNNNDPSMTFWQLYRECRSQFVASSEIQLRQLLVEFADHQLTKLVWAGFMRFGIRRHESQGDMIMLCVDVALIKTFLVEKGEMQE